MRHDHYHFQLIGVTGEAVDLNACSESASSLLLKGHPRGVFGPPPIGRNVVVGGFADMTKPADDAPRRPVLPLTLRCESPAELAERVGWFAGLVDQGVEQRCTLLATAPDGTVSELSMRYDGGADALAIAASDSRIVDFSAWFVADSVWTRGQEHTQSFDLSDGAVSKQILNPGTATALPVWSVSAPLTRVTVINNTTGRRWAWAGDHQSISVASNLVADCRDVSPTMTKAGKSKWDGLDASDLWPLAAGINEILIETEGHGAGTNVELSWFPRYRSC